MRSPRASVTFFTVNTNRSSFGAPPDDLGLGARGAASSERSNATIWLMIAFER